MKDKPGLDKMDLMIMAELQKDGRKAATDIANNLGTSRATIHRRLKRILGEGIVSVVGIPDLASLGDMTMATIGVNVAPGAVPSVVARLVSHQSIHFVSTCTGRYDIIVWGVFKSRDALLDFLSNQMGGIPGLTGSETMLSLAVNKRSSTYALGYESHAQPKHGPAKQRLAGWQTGDESCISTPGAEKQQASRSAT